MASSSAQLRKLKKPMIEKRRRERMNDCLDQLKKLIFDGQDKEMESRYSKMEKVHILEMTVRYIRDLLVTKGSMGGCSSSPSDSQAAASHSRFVDGFNECAAECVNFLTMPDLNQNVDQEAGSRLMKHLSSRHVRFSITPKASSFITQQIDSPLPHQMGFSVPNKIDISDESDATGFESSDASPRDETPSGSKYPIISMEFLGTSTSVPISLPTVFAIVPQHSPSTNGNRIQIGVVPPGMVSPQPIATVQNNSFGGVIPLYACPTITCPQDIRPVTIYPQGCSPLQFSSNSNNSFPPLNRNTPPSDGFIQRSPHPERSSGSVWCSTGFSESEVVWRPWNSSGRL